MFDYETTVLFYIVLKVLILPVFSVLGLVLFYIYKVDAKIKLQTEIMLGNIFKA